MTSKEDISRLKQHLDFLYFKANFVDKKPIERTKATIESIERDLEKSRKLEKAVAIMKKKRVSLVYFVYEIRADKNRRNYLDYKYWAFSKVKSKQDLLTEDEFNSLEELFDK